MKEVTFNNIGKEGLRERVSKYIRHYDLPEEGFYDLLQEIFDSVTETSDFETDLENDELKKQLFIQLKENLRKEEQIRKATEILNTKVITV